VVAASRYDPNYYNLGLAAMKIVHDFGFQRVNRVLSDYLQLINDARISTANREWAQGFPSLNDAVETLNTHPIVLDGFANHIRKLNDAVGADRFALPGHAENGESVQGYEIIRAIQFDDQRGFAIGCSSTAPTSFVCWQFTTENGQRDYYWGQYTDELQSAADNLIARVINHLDDKNVKEIQKPQTEPALESATQEEKPSVLGQIREAKKTPKPLRDEKPKAPKPKGEMGI
jgi:hypothetical protein